VEIKISGLFFFFFLIIMIDYIDVSV